MYRIKITEHLGFANNIQAQRDPDEEGDYMAFEQLMAEAAVKKGKDGKEEKKDDKKDAKKGKKDDSATSHHQHHHGFHARDKNAESTRPV